jgi:hypothetical protein
MNKLFKQKAARNGGSLPLLEYGERQRWADLSLAARMIRRRCRIDSPATAQAIAELAGLHCGADR